MMPLERKLRWPCVFIFCHLLPTRKPTLMRLLSCFLILIAFYIPHAQARQSCPAGLSLSTPSSDFENAGFGLVLHKPTGLMWKRCVEGMAWNGSGCSSSPVTLAWEDAFDRVVAVNKAPKLSAERLNQRASLLVRYLAPSLLIEPFDNLGYDDWRLPNVNELRSIVETGCSDPASNVSEFPDEKEGMFSDLFPGPNAKVRYFWSSSPVMGTQDRAWRVGFFSGLDGVSPVKTMAMVRLVRAGSGFHGFDASSIPARPSPMDAPSRSVGEVLEDAALTEVARAEGADKREVPQSNRADGEARFQQPISTIQQDGEGVVVEGTAVEDERVAAARSAEDLAPMSVPSLGEWGLLLLSLLAAGLGLHSVRRR